MPGRDLFPGARVSPGRGVIRVVVKGTEMPVSDEDFVKGLTDGDEDFGTAGQEVFHKMS